MVQDSAILIMNHEQCILSHCQVCRWWVSRVVVSRVSQVFHPYYNYGAHFDIFVSVLAFFPYCLGGRRSLQRGTLPDTHSVYIVSTLVTLSYVK